MVSTNKKLDHPKTLISIYFNFGNFRCFFSHQQYVCPLISQKPLNYNFFLFLNLFIYLSIYLSMYLPNFLYIFLSIFLAIFLSISPSNFLSIYLSHTNCNPFKILEDLRKKVFSILVCKQFMGNINDL